MQSTTNLIPPHSMSRGINNIPTGAHGRTDGNQQPTKIFFSLNYIDYSFNTTLMHRIRYSKVQHTALLFHPVVNHPKVSCPSLKWYAGWWNAVPAFCLRPVCCPKIQRYTTLLCHGPQYRGILSYHKMVITYSSMECSSSMQKQGGVLS